MNESIYINLTPAGFDFLNSTGFIIESNPYAFLEVLETGILFIITCWFICWCFLYFPRRKND